MITKEIILDIIRNCSSSFYHHGVVGWDNVVFEHNFDDLADKIMMELKQSICPHTKKYNKSGMGGETCKLCGLVKE